MTPGAAVDILRGALRLERPARRWRVIASQGAQAVEKLFNQ